MPQHVQRLLRALVPRRPSDRGAVRGRGPFRARGLALVAVIATATATLTTGAATAVPSSTPSLDTPDLGTSVTVFDPSMPVAQIQAELDKAWAKQVDNEMGSARYAFLFKPGTYGTEANPLQVKVGYYTEIAGLGASPTDVTINGKVEVYNRCLADGGTSNCIALNNFWRTLSNLFLRVNSAGQDGCRASAEFWAVSQAVSMRRLDISGANLSLMDYCTAGPQYASGGFIADSRMPFVINGSQQQWLTRNSEITGWSNAVWNATFSGVVGAPSEAGFPDPAYTTLDQTPVSREKPFLFVDDQDRYAVRVPAAQRNSRGVTWADGLTAGRTIPLSEFFVARPGTPVQEINNHLAQGRHLLLTPGIYDIDRTIEVKRPDTVVLGLGHATLTAVGGAVPLEIKDVPGVVVAGVTVDAGTVESPALLRVGSKNGNDGASKDAASNPTTLSDVYFRVGGPHVGKTDLALEVNSDDVLIDHTWVWRADHGTEGFTEGVNGDTDRWRTNIGRTGVVVNGDDVTATGLFVEHFQQHNVIWNGERGTTVFFQNELPYDPPTQADWMDGDKLGWAAYKVADDVEHHRLYAGGVYVFNQNNPSIHTENGFEVPQTPGVALHHILTVNLTAGTIDHVVNGVGGPADTTRVGVPVYVEDYPAP
ncbi:adenylyl cyclase [Knoellia sp. 3-2P3]|uniref:adenylyl cyclase n=1 Tax=unclassified Knoellia TaxID=2618719 RepID=UPI0023DB405B|nr:adenylyl cyclase [Knoellia sp. 3-2P3]MDF2091256.1 adenylyl cyclase [Knoellia sp. 3-2P3]